jgi:hypothetical protein
MDLRTGTTIMDIMDHRIITALKTASLATTMARTVPTNVMKTPYTLRPVETKITWMTLNPQQTVTGHTITTGEIGQSRRDRTTTLRIIARTMMGLAATATPQHGRPAPTAGRTAWTMQATPPLSKAAFPMLPPTSAATTGTARPTAGEQIPQTRHRAMASHPTRGGLMMTTLLMKEREGLQTACLMMKKGLTIRRGRPLLHMKVTGHMMNVHLCTMTPLVRTPWKAETLTTRDTAVTMTQTSVTVTTTCPAPQIPPTVTEAGRSGRDQKIQCTFLTAVVMM